MRTPPEAIGEHIGDPPAVRAQALADSLLAYGFTEPQPGVLAKAMTVLIEKTPLSPARGSEDELLVSILEIVTRAAGSHIDKEESDLLALLKMMARSKLFDGTSAQQNQALQLMNDLKNWIRSVKAQI